MALRDLALPFLLITSVSHAQDVAFATTPAAAMAAHIAGDSLGLCVDSMAVDTVYYLDPVTGKQQQGVQRYPLARYEYYADGALYRRIDIKQANVADTTLVLDLNSGELVSAVDSITQDTPSGIYHVFFPNGNIRVRGRLNGLDAQGHPRKTGDWTEWDASGAVIRKETYP